VKKTAMLLLSISIAFILLLSGCVSQQKEVKKEEPVKEIVWPLPPEKPRVKWIAQYRGSQDLQKGSDILRFLGEERVITLGRPHGIVADRDGNIYVSDIGRGRLAVFVFDFKNKKFRTLGRKGVLKVKIPLGLAIDNERGLIFVADIGNDMVLAIDKDEDEIKFIIGQKPGTFKRPVAVAVDPPRKRVYVADTKLQEIKAFDYDSKLLWTIGKGKRSPDDDGFNDPVALAVDRNGNLYVADKFNRYIKVFSQEGKFIKKIGYGAGLGSGNFSKLVGVALDSDDHIYGVDTDFCNFQIFDQDNNLLLFVGEPGGTPGKFLTPTHIYIDEKDTIYVADTFNRRVQVLQYLKEENK